MSENQYNKGVVPRSKEFSERLSFKGILYKFIKETLQKESEDAFEKAGYKIEPKMAGEYADDTTYGTGVEDNTVNIKVGGKTESLLNKYIVFGGKRMIIDINIVYKPKENICEITYKNSEDLSFRGFKKFKDGFLVNETIVFNGSNVSELKSKIQKKLKEFSKKEVEYMTNTKLGTGDANQKSTASVVENKLNFSSLISETAESCLEKMDEKNKDQEDDNLLLGDNKIEEGRDSMKTLQDVIATWNEEHNTDFSIKGAYGNYELWCNSRRIEVGSLKDVRTSFMKEKFNEKNKKSENTSENTTLGSAGAISYDAPMGGVQKRSFNESEENSQMENFKNTPYYQRLQENRRPSNIRPSELKLIQESDGFWTAVPMETLDGYKKDHIMGAPGSENIEVNSKKEEEYNSGGISKFPSGRKKKKLKEEGYALDYLNKNEKVICIQDKTEKTIFIYEGATKEDKSSNTSLKYVKSSDILKLVNEGVYTAILLNGHKLVNENTDKTIDKRFKFFELPTQTELNDRWNKLANFETLEESTKKLEESTKKVEKNMLEENKTSNLNRNLNVSDGEFIDGKKVITIEKMNKFTPVYHKVFEQDYLNENKAFIWDFNSGNLVQNPTFKIK